MNILVVDDNIDNLKVVSGFLKGKGYKIALALNGEDALKVLAKSPMDLVLLDVMMPVLDGFEVCTRIKANNNLKEIPVIFLTAKNETEDLMKGFAVGAVDYIIKPFRKEELLVRVNTHLELYKSKREIRVLNKNLTKAKEKAEESSKYKESFLANMSHEIRTPLNAIVGIIRKLNRNEVEPEKLACLGRAKAASDHLLSIISNILDLSKIEAGELSISNNDFSLSHIVDDVLKILHVTATSNGNILEKSIDSNLFKAYKGDKSRIRQVLINLVGNALKFTNNGQVLISCKVVSTNEDVQSVEIAIEDNGIGMDQDFVHRVFNKFSQADVTASRKHQGTGLGMSISRELVNLMGGDISVESEKGVGTKVKMVLAFLRGDKENVFERLDDFKLQNLKGKRILLVEDNEVNRMVAVQTLKVYGLVSDEAYDGKLACDMLSKNTYDAILMDVQMPVMDGIEATRVIRNKLKVDTPIIALTANAFKNEIKVCMEAGMQEYVTKPFEEQTLIGAIYKQVLHKNDSSELAKQKIMSPQTEKLYNLDNLMTLSRGDMAFMKKMLELFVRETPPAVQQIKEAFKKADWNTVKKVSHRIKPSIRNLNISPIAEDIVEVERLAMENPDDEILEQLINRVEAVIQEVVLELRKEAECL